MIHTLPSVVVKGLQRVATMGNKFVLITFSAIFFTSFSIVHSCRCIFMEPSELACQLKHQFVGIVTLLDDGERVIHKGPLSNEASDPPFKTFDIIFNVTQSEVWKASQNVTQISTSTTSCGVFGQKDSRKLVSGNFTEPGVLEVNECSNIWMEIGPLSDTASVLRKKFEKCDN